MSLLKNLFPKGKLNENDRRKPMKKRLNKQQSIQIIPQELIQSMSKYPNSPMQGILTYVQQHVQEEFAKLTESDLKDDVPTNTMEYINDFKDTLPYMYFLLENCEKLLDTTVDSNVKLSNDKLYQIWKDFWLKSVINVNWNKKDTIYSSLYKHALQATVLQNFKRKLIENTIKEINKIIPKYKRNFMSKYSRENDELKKKKILRVFHFKIGKEVK